jgi:hypothetical protein
MISGGDDGTMRKGSVRMAPGLGLVRNCIIDTHFLDRGRVGRLLEVVATNPGHVGLGVGEDTAILVRDGHMVEVIGSGVVVVVDGTNMRTTNLAHADPDQPIAVEGLMVHTLAPGYQYDLKESRYIAPPRPDPEDEEPGGRDDHADGAETRSGRRERRPKTERGDTDRPSRDAKDPIRTTVEASGPSRRR